MIARPRHGTGAPQPFTPARASRFDWWTEALVLVLAIGETAAVWLVADLVLGAARSSEIVAVSPVAVFLLIYAGAAAPRWLDAFDVWEPWYQVLLGAVVAASTLTAVKLISYPDAAWFSFDWLPDMVRALIVRPNESVVPVWGVVGLAVYAWWRGRRHDDPGADAAYQVLRAGTLIVVGAVLARSIAVDGDAGTGVAAAVVVFFAGTLGAIALARMEQEQTRGTAPVGADWLPAFLGPVALIALLATAVVGIFSRDVLETLLWVLAPVVWALSVVFRVIVLILALVAFILVSPILWLLSGHTFDLAGVRIGGGPISMSDLSERGTDRAAQVPDPIRYLVALAVLSFLFTTVVRFMLRRRRRRPRETMEEREAVAGFGDLLAAAAARLRGLLQRDPSEPDPLDRLRGDARWAHTVEIRETYRQFLAWSAEQHLARPAPATPHEHAERLAPMVRRAGLDGDLQVLTDRYTGARYGGQPATPDEAREARTAWKRLRHAPDRT